MVHLQDIAQEQSLNSRGLGMLAHRASSPAPHSPGNPASGDHEEELPPFAQGIAPMRRSPVGAKAANSGISFPLSSNSSSGL